MMVGDQITVLRDDRSAADRLHFHFASFVILGGDDMNAHQRGLHFGNGGIDLRPQTSGDILSSGAGEPDGGKQGPGKKQPPEHTAWIHLRHAYPCRESACACKF